MKFEFVVSLKTNLSKINTECLVLTTSCLNLYNLNKETMIYLKKIIELEGFTSEHKHNKHIMLFQVPGVNAKRVMLIHTSNNECSEIQFLEIIKGITSNIHKHKISNIVIYLRGYQIRSRDESWQLMQFSLNLNNNLYIFDQYKSKKNQDFTLKSIKFVIDPALVPYAKLILKQAYAMNNSCNLVKNLANTPPNVCNTEFMASAAIRIKQQSPKLKLKILEKKDLQKFNMGAFLAVAQGSLQPPKLICLEYNGNKDPKNQPIVLIGKGITFDTGGNSLKSPSSMVGMKFDMCGAATVLGLINFAVEMNLNLNIVGLIATAENMPGRHACRPDDVVTTMSGLTVEILNTDAEGRLLLCEALTYSEKFKPKAVIDIATLTGSCAATFGHYYSGLFSNDKKLAKQLIKAGNNISDKVWELPITEEYHKLLDSDIADLANVGGSHAGSITAACFLARFAEKYSWAHLDIAGTAYYQDGKIQKQPSGRCLPMLAQYLMELVQN